MNMVESVLLSSQLLLTLGGKGLYYIIVYQRTLLSSRLF